MRYISAIRKLIKSVALTKYGIYVLAFVSFIEAILFPVTPLVVLIVLCSVNKDRWLLYGIVIAVFGTLGSCITYLIGYHLGEYVVSCVFYNEDFIEHLELVSHFYSSNEVRSIFPFIGSFLPLTYNIVALFCGIMENATNRFNDIDGIYLLNFAVLCLLGKLIRFIVEAWAIKTILQGGNFIANFLKNKLVYHGKS